MFPANTYRDRRDALSKQFDSGILFFLGNEESPMNYADNIYRFRQDSNFLYYFGLDQPHLAGLIDIDEQKTILFGNELTIEHVVWMGPQPALSEQAAEIGISDTRPYNDLAAYLEKAVKAKRPIHFSPPYRGENILKLQAWLGTTELESSEALVKAIVAQRLVKSEEEIQQMEKALAITKQMFVNAIKTSRPGIKEAKLSGQVEGIALATEGQLAYPAILTVNGQTLHNHYHGNTLKSGQLVLGDFGAEAPYSHYASDITRTWPVDGTFTEKQKAIYQIVLDAQMAVIEALKPGVRFLDMHLLSAKIITEGLQSLGLMKGDADAAVKAGAHALFFPHGLGHAIGLDVHDMEDLGENHVGYGDELERSTQFGLKSLRFARAVQPGHVLTVEPGLYFIPELIEQWQKEGKHTDFIVYEKLQDYLSFSGVRIEDNILITEDGHRVLGPAIPKTIAEIEALRS
jgi:Xaa-Pro aminopeptidase